MKNKKKIKDIKSKIKIDKNWASVSIENMDFVEKEYLELKNILSKVNKLKKYKEHTPLEIPQNREIKNKRIKINFSDADNEILKKFRITRKLDKIRQRTENIITNQLQNTTEEIENIIEKLDEYFIEKDFKIQNFINDIRRNIDIIISGKHIKTEENKINSVEILPKVLPETIDYFSWTKYETFLKAILSKDWLHHSISSTNNPDYYSKWDWSFAVKIWRPFLNWVRELFLSWKINPEKTSWKDICEKYNENIDENRKYIHNIINILKNFDEVWDFIDIFENFLKAVDELSKTNYYFSWDSKENLYTTKIILGKIYEQFAS